MTNQLWNDIQAINDIHAAIGKPPVTEETFKRKRSESDAMFRRRVRNYEIAQYDLLQRHVRAGAFELPD